MTAHLRIWAGQALVVSLLLATGFVSLASPPGGLMLIPNRSAPSGPVISLWQNATSVVSGSPPSDLQMGYDSTLGAILGVGQSNSSSVETWTYAAGYFNRSAPVRSPPHVGALVGDPSTGGMILLDRQTEPMTSWRYSAANWTYIASNASPAGMAENGSAAYDPALHLVILVGMGGYTWTFNGTQWANVSASQRLPVAGSLGGVEVVYDSFLGEIIALASVGTSLPSVSTFTFNSSGWAALCAHCGPDPSDALLVADDPHQFGLLAFGWNGSLPANRTWLLEKQNWTPEVLGGSPEPRLGGALAYDSADGYLLLYGGAGMGLGTPTTLPYCWWWGGPIIPTYPIQVQIQPASAGWLLWEGRPYRNGSSLRTVNGSFSTSLVAAGNGSLAWYRLQNWSVSGGLSDLGNQVIVSGAGGVISAVFTPYPIVGFHSEACGGITLNGTPYPKDTSANVLVSQGPVPISAASCSWARFAGWVASGGVSVANSTLPESSAEVSSNGTLTAVYSTLGSGPTIESFSVVPAITRVGTPVRFQVNATGGLPPYSLQIGGLPAGCSSTGLNFTCMPRLPGVFNLTANLTDANRSVASTTARLVVLPSRVSLQILAFVADPSSLTLGQTTTFQLTISGGSGPFQIYYGGLPGGCSSMNSTTLACTPNVPGAFRVTALVSDGLGRVASATANLSVAAAPTGVNALLVSPAVDIALGVAAGLATAAVVVAFARIRGRPPAPSDPADDRAMNPT